VLDLSGTGGYSEKSIRLNFEKLFDFVCLNTALIKKSCIEELIAAFDPSCIPRSGKQTPGFKQMAERQRSMHLKRIGD